MKLWQWLKRDLWFFEIFLLIFCFVRFFPDSLVSLFIIFYIFLWSFHSAVVDCKMKDFFSITIEIKNKIKYIRKLTGRIRIFYKYFKYYWMKKNYISYYISYIKYKMLYQKFNKIYLSDFHLKSKSTRTKYFILPIAFERNESFISNSIINIWRIIRYKSDV